MGLFIRLSLLWDLDMSMLSPLIVYLSLGGEEKDVMNLDLIHEVAPDLYEKIQEWPRVESSEAIQLLDLKETGVLGTTLCELNNEQISVTFSCDLCIIYENLQLAEIKHMDKEAYDHLTSMVLLF